MGSQTRLARRLMDSFVITEDDSFKLARRFEELELGDELSDALYDISEGRVQEGFAHLLTIVDHLNIKAHQLKVILENMDRRLVSE